MKSSILASALLTALFQIPAYSASCASLHMIVARASTEAPGEGIIGTVVKEIAKVINGTDSVAVQYPATLTNYEHSEGLGTADMNKLIDEYYAQCPNGLIALFGYSQGAQVVGDVLCGTSEKTFKTTPPLAAQYGKNVIAAIQMGDPSNVVGLPWDAGTATKNGTFPRMDTNACKPFASKIQSYCDKNDLYCASGSSLSVHYGYIYKYQKVARDFVVKQYQAANGAKPGSTPATGATPSPTQTPKSGATPTPTPTPGTGTKTPGSATPKTPGSGSSKTPGSGASSTKGGGGGGASSTMGAGVGGGGNGGNGGGGGAAASTSAPAPTHTGGSIRSWSLPGAKSWILAGVFALIL